MATEIYLTDGAIRVTTSGAIQALVDALEVGKFDQADLILHVLSMEGTPGSVTVTLMGGMSKETEDGWVPVGSFPAISNSNKPEPLHITGLFKYLRWKVGTFPGGLTAITFTVRGMARAN